jgi:hypothetical protein
MRNLCPDQGRTNSNFKGLEDKAVVSHISRKTSEIWGTQGSVGNWNS